MFKNQCNDFYNTNSIFLIKQLFVNIINNLTNHNKIKDHLIIA